MAFRGDLPYIAKGETLDSLNNLRREVQNFQGYKVRFNDTANGSYVQDNKRTDLPEELHELLRLLLSRSPEQRPSCQEVLVMMNKPHRKLSQTLAVNSSLEILTRQGLCRSNNSDRFRFRHTSQCEPASAETTANRAYVHSSTKTYRCGRGGGRSRSIGGYSFRRRKFGACSLFLERLCRRRDLPGHSSDTRRDDRCGMGLDPVLYHQNLISYDPLFAVLVFRNLVIPVTCAGMLGYLLVWSHAQQEE
jgi:hypothetical protein